MKQPGTAEETEDDKSENDFAIVFAANGVNLETANFFEETLKRTVAWRKRSYF